MAKDRDADAWLSMMFDRYRQQNFCAGVAHGIGNLKEEKMYLDDAVKTLQQINQELANR